MIQNEEKKESEEKKRDTCYKNIRRENEKNSDQTYYILQQCRN